MKRATFLFVCMFVVSSSHGVVVTGSLVDSATGAPVENALLTFRVQQGLVANSSADGHFSVTLSVERNFPLQVIVEKTGYVTRKLEILIVADSMDMGRNALAKLAESTIVFCGVVVDSVTGAPITGVWMVLREWSASAPVQQFESDAEGKFSQTITLTNDPNRRMRWIASDSGYYSESGNLTTAMDGEAQTILLNPEGSLRIAVSGTVVDSMTRRPLANAKVVLGTSYHDALPDSLYTGDNGVIAASIQVGLTSSNIPSLYYRIEVDGYSLKTGAVMIPGAGEIDLGDLALVSLGNTGTLPLQRAETRQVSSGNGRVFSLDGRAFGRATISGKPGTRAGVGVVHDPGEPGGKGRAAPARTVVIVR